MSRPLRSRAKIMRRAGVLRHEPTPAEAKLWAYLRNSNLRGLKFRRQHAIGRYVVDFCAPKDKLVVELDGSEHLHQQEPDSARTRFLEAQGYVVLRFWNDKVLNDVDGVVRAIQDALKRE